MKKLKVPKSMLVYADFKRKVLLQAQKDLDKFSDIIFTFNGTLQCSTKGNLYYKEFFEIDIHPKKAKLLWEKLHENRDKLLVFKESREELKESINRLSN